MKIQIFFISMILFTMLSCSDSNKKIINDEKCYSHDYKKYYEKYSFDSLKNLLFADTLDLGPPLEGFESQVPWYKDRINELLTDLKDDRGQPDSLFPMTKFDAVIITAKPYFGRTVTLTNKQISDLLEIINDPVSFDWSETTPDIHYYVIFMYEGEVVRKLSICSCNSCLKPEPGRPVFKKMKFGSLHRDKIVQLGRLLRDIGFEEAQI